MLNNKNEPYFTGNKIQYLSFKDLTQSQNLHMEVRNATRNV